MKFLINKDIYDVVLPIWIMEDSSTLQCESLVRGYHVYINIWDPLVSDCLKSRKQPTNGMSKTAAAVIRFNSYSEEVVLGHVPNNMSKIVFMFLSLSHCALDIFVDGKYTNSGGRQRLKIPANVYLYGPEKAINWLKNKINKIEEKLKK